MDSEFNFSNQRPYSSFEILYTSDDDDYTRIYQILCGTPRNSPGLSIWRSMFEKPSPKCKCVILEHNHLDFDFTSSYSTFYYRSPVNISRFTSRLHLFSKLIDQNTNNVFDFSIEIAYAYIGYVTIRPTPVNVIGKTILLIPEQEDGNEYVTCAESYEVSLAGNKLVATGALFQQQDARVSACASTAVHITSAYMHKRFDMDFLSTPDISNQASMYDNYLGRGIPSRGLSTSQIGKVLDSIGYDVVIYGTDSELNLESKDIIYNTSRSCNHHHRSYLEIR